MSRLLDHIKVINTGRREAITHPLKLVDAKLETQNSPIENYATVYKVTATLGTQFAISDELKASMLHNFDCMLRDKVYSPLAEEIFGEFRAPLLEAELAVFQGDYAKATELINSVLKNMFSV